MTTVETNQTLRGVRLAGAELPTQTRLVRAMGRWDIVGLIINMMVGAGIFGLPSKIFVLTGVWSVLAYLVCAALITLITLCFAEVGSRFSESGGPYLHARVAFGPFVGFQVGWLLWLARVTASAALCNLFLGYLSFFWPAAASGWTRALVITVVFTALTTINIIGVRETAVVNNLFTIGKLTPLLLFVVLGLFFLSPQAFTAPTMLALNSFSKAVVLLIFAFSGFEMAMVPAGETRNPRGYIAFALLIATIVVTLLYLVVQIVCIGTLPSLANSERPLVDASTGFLGAAGASIISIGALVSIFGTLNSGMLVGPRILFAMAEQGQLPGVLAATHRRFRTPHFAILISAVVILVVTLEGTFMSTLTISTVIRLLCYISTCISLPVLRRKADVPLPRFSAPAGIVVACLATALSVLVLCNSAAQELRQVAVVGSLGIVIFLLLGGLKSYLTADARETF
ncbi:MAG TPA: amino acid permease [Pyrinomonadaceae bacterium]|nr:amino acid permease [Pyrinomonadaceae bacterium]